MRCIDPPLEEERNHLLCRQTANPLNKIVIQDIGRSDKTHLDIDQPERLERPGITAPDRVLDEREDRFEAKIFPGRRGIEQG